MNIFSGSSPLIAQGVQLADEWGPFEWFLAAIAAFVGLFLLGFILFFFRYISLWLQAYMSNAKVSPFELIGMGLRQVNPRVIVDAKIIGDAGRRRYRPRDRHLDQTRRSSLPCRG